MLWWDMLVPWSTIFEQVALEWVWLLSLYFKHTHVGLSHSLWRSRNWGLCIYGWNCATCTIPCNVLIIAHWHGIPSSQAQATFAVVLPKLYRICRFSTEETYDSHKKISICQFYHGIWATLNSPSNSEVLLSGNHPREASPVVGGSARKSASATLIGGLQCGQGLSGMVKVVH